MKHAPIYRRRRRVAVAVAVTVAAMPFIIWNDSDADIPVCHAWQNAEQCKVTP